MIKVLYNGLKTSPDPDITVCFSHSTVYLMNEKNTFLLCHDSFKLLVMKVGCGVASDAFQPGKLENLQKTHYLHIKVFVYLWVASRKVWHYT